MKRTQLAGIASVLVAVAVPLAQNGVAVASPQVGACTSSYEPNTYDQLSPTDAALTIDLFNAIDTNHNGVLCFKPYSNGDHHGHAGNLVDDKSGPKS